MAHDWHEISIDVLRHPALSCRGGPTYTEGVTTGAHASQDSGERRVDIARHDTPAGRPRGRHFSTQDSIVKPEPPIRRSTNVALTAAIACVMCPFPRGAFAGPISVDPGVELEVRQDQLPGEGSQSEGWIARVSPRLSLGRVGPRSTLEMTGIRSYDSNERLSGPTWVGDEAALRFVETSSPYASLSTFGGYVSSRDPLATKTLAPVTFHESAIGTGGVRLERWRLEGGYQVRSHTYESAGQLDGLSQTWDAALFPFRRPDMSLVVSGRGRDVRVQNERALSTVDLTAGMRRTHFEGLSSEFELGAASTRDPIRGTNSWDLAVVAGLTADRGTLHLPVDLRFHFVRDVATTGFAEVSLPGRRSRLAARWEQTLGAEGGYFADPTMSKYLTFEARDTLRGAYAVSLEGSFGQTRSYFDDGPWLKTHRLWASLSRGLMPWLSMGIDYSFVNQDGDSSVPSWVFQRNRLGLRLTLGAQ
jgi:hypothetical protein